ncbi:MAG: YkgJ family cysteine cluster protein [Akkermansiaceae bacterium]|nr:YkgJ family cysteine cluster protein [Akkermansiaceae bacterium]
MSATPDHGSPGNRETVLDPTVHYVCQRCTACCKWPGDVRIEDDEISPIAAFLGLTERDFLDTYTRLRSNRQGLSLIEKDNHECIMLDGRDCRIQRVKPEQCRGFPNTWNFPGWEQICHAIPVAVPIVKSPPVDPGGEQVTSGR